MPLDGKLIFEASITMMRRVLDDECTRLIIRRNSIQGEGIARVIMHAFLAGRQMTASSLCSYAI